MRTLRAALTAAVMIPAAMALAPVAHAIPQIGHYNAWVDGRADFHTWIWSFSSCNPPGTLEQCATVSANPMPIARAFQWYAPTRAVNGPYTLTVDVPDGLRCGNVYYGAIIPTHDVYTFDGTTLTGKLDSYFDVGCDNAPAGMISYPFRLVRL
jgi:hypothetical protein